MIGTIGTCLALGLTSPPEEEVTYGFASESCVIEMTVRFLEPYLGRRLAFYNSLTPHEETCLSDDGKSGKKCTERFVGAVALVRFSVKRRQGKPQTRSTIREHVSVVSQSPDLPERAAFSKTVELLNGTASDTQLFGYDEAAIPEPDRPRALAEAKRTSWRIYRQELFIGGEAQPFAVVEWKHTIDRIRIVRTYAPPRQ